MRNDYLPKIIILHEVENSNEATADQKTEDKIMKESLKESAKIDKKIEELSGKEKEELREILFKKAAKEEETAVISFNDYSQALDDFLAKPLPTSFYKGMNPEQEFGVARVLADQVSQLPSLLKEAEVMPCGKNTYKIISKKLVSKGRSELTFELSFMANNNEEAVQTSKAMKEKLTTIWQKMWLACWRIGNKKHQLSFSVNLLELMREVHPKRTEYFSEREKALFYEELRQLKIPEFILEKTVKFKNKTKEKKLKRNMPFLFVEGGVGDQGLTPSIIKINLFNIDPSWGKIDSVAAPIKNTTLLLDHRDTALGFYLQDRFNQLKGESEEKRGTLIHSFQRDQLILIANLAKTDQSNPRQANKRLVDKLNRLKQQQIIKGFNPQFENGVIFIEA